MPLSALALFLGKPQFVLVVNLNPVCKRGATACAAVGSAAAEVFASPSALFSLLEGIGGFPIALLKEKGFTEKALGTLDAGAASPEAVEEAALFCCASADSAGFAPSDDAAGAAVDGLIAPKFSATGVHFATEGLGTRSADGVGVSSFSTKPKECLGAAEVPPLLRANSFLHKAISYQELVLETGFRSQKIPAKFLWSFSRTVFVQ